MRGPRRRLGRGRKRGSGPKPKLKAESPKRDWAEELVALSVFVLSPLTSTTLIYSLFSLPKLLWLWLGLSVKRKTVGTPLDTVLKAALVVGIVSTLFAGDQARAVIGSYNNYSYGLLALVVYCGYLKWGATVSRPSRYLKWAGYTAIAIAVIAIFESYFDVFLIRRVNLPSGRAVASIGGPVALGAYLAACFPLVSPWAWPVLGAGVMATGSRGAILAAVAGLVASRIPPKYRLVTIGAFAIGLVSVMSIRDTSVSDTNRMRAWKYAYGQMIENPVTGVGLDNFWMELGGGLRHENAHNDLLQAGATAGVPGALTYIYFWIMVFMFAPSGTALAVFTASQFNPISIELGAVLAAVTGLSLKSTRPIGEPWRVRSVAWLGLVLFAWLFVADYFFKAKDFTRAVSMAPWERKYRIAYINWKRDY